MKNQRNHASVLSPSPANRAASAGRAVIEPLEDRRLLAVISGVIYTDGDNNALRGFFEDGLPDQTVFLDSNANGQFDEGEPTQTTDARGRYRFSGLTDGTYYVGLLNPDGLGQTSPGLAGRVPTGFDIDVVFPDDSLTDAQKDVFETAAQKWESLVTGDLPDVTLSDGTIIDDLQIRATAINLDGPGGVLGRASFNDLRSGDEGGLPFTGAMEFDTADLDGDGLESVILHEMGHVLGIGTLWQGPLPSQRFLSGVTDRPGDNPLYDGANAVRESNLLLRQDADVVAVEPGGRAGSSYSHWRESTFGTELMTPGLNGGVENPLSRLTIGGLQDLGYQVNFLNVDVYRGIGPLQTDIVQSFENVARVPFEIGITLRTGDDNFDQANFGVRANANPNPFFFQVGPVVQTPGEPVTLLATVDTSTDSRFTGDTDFRDSIIQMNFYRETNGVPGLQTKDNDDTGVEGDELLDEQPGSPGSYTLQVETDDFDAGDEQIFYARGFDTLYFTQDRAVILNVVGDQDAPAKPSSIQAVGVSTRDVLVTFTDNSDDESGFLLEASSDPNFDIPASIQRIYLPPSEGTGPASYTFSTELGPVTERSFRVRAYNTGGSSPFAGRALARTLSRGEVLVDNDAAGAVTTEGFTTVRSRANAVAGTFLQGTSGFADFDPMLASAGNYFVFVRSVDIGQAGSVAVSVFGQSGELLDTVDIDQDASADGDVLLGSYALGADSYVRIARTSGTATADTVRFLPVG